MKVTEIKTWKDLSGFVSDRVSGIDKSEISDDDWVILDKNAKEILVDVGADEIQNKAKKLMNVNILDKNTDFKFFEKVPNIWRAYYTTSIGLVAANYGSAV